MDKEKPVPRHDYQGHGPLKQTAEKSEWNGAAVRIVEMRWWLVLFVLFLNDEYYE